MRNVTLHKKTQPSLVVAACKYHYAESIIYRVMGAYALSSFVDFLLRRT